MVNGDAFAGVIADARRGNQAAIEALYRHVAPMVVGYLRGHGANDVDDLASEVFVGMIRGLPSFEGDARRFRSWVLTIAHRRLVDTWRRTYREPEMHSLDGVELTETSSGVEDEVMSSMSLAEVLDLLDTVTPAQRSVLLLRLVADLSLREVADVLGRPVGVVKSLQLRGLRAVARHLDVEPVRRGRHLSLEGVRHAG